MVTSPHKWNILSGTFVCLFKAVGAIFQLSGGCHHYRRQGCKFWPMLGAQGLWAGRDLYRATPTATRDLGFYGLLRKTGTHVPQWDSNSRRKDHQIIAPDALTTAPCRRKTVNNQSIGKWQGEDCALIIWFRLSRRCCQCIIGALWSISSSNYDKDIYG
jgi:hypothetical protein